MAFVFCDLHISHRASNVWFWSCLTYTFKLTLTGRTSLCVFGLVWLTHSSWQTGRAFCVCIQVDMVGLWSCLTKAFKLTSGLPICYILGRLTPVLQFKRAFSPSSTNSKGHPLKKNMGGATTTVTLCTHAYSQDNINYINNESRPRTLPQYRLWNYFITINEQ